MFYGYLNLESTKTRKEIHNGNFKFYGYLNLESTKTHVAVKVADWGFTVT